MDQVQSDIGPHCSSKRLLKHFSGRQKQTMCFMIGALVVQKCLLRRFLRADKQIFLGEIKICRLKKAVIMFHQYQPQISPNLCLYLRYKFELFICTEMSPR